MKNTLTTTTLPAFMNQRGIGFDRMFDLFDDAVGYAGNVSYPPYNLIRVTDDDYVVELALAGFDMEDIEITQDRNKLLIEGHKPELQDDEVTYLHRGISARAFTREFVLAEHVSVTDAEFDSGILRVKLHRDLPEDLKPRTVEIKKLGK